MTNQGVLIAPPAPSCLTRCIFIKLKKQSMIER